MKVDVDRDHAVASCAKTLYFDLLFCSPPGVHLAN